jgi:hypothetical protein
VRALLNLITMAALVACMGGCGGGDRSSSATAKSAPPVPPPSEVAASRRSHVVVIVMENKEYGEVIGSRSAPYVTSLARRYANATNFHGIRHPSLPNYLALTGGSTFGVKSNCTDCNQDAESIVDQLESAGVSWKAYMEGMPRACFTGAQSGIYVKKHNPFAYYPNVIDNPRRCRKIVSFRELSADLTAKRLPTFSFIAPNLCHDMHDCSIRVGDRFLSKLIPRVVEALGPHGFLVITFDEGITDDGCCGHGSGGRIPTIVAGPDVAPGTSTDDPVNHYGVLATISAALGLKPLGVAADRRSGSLDGLFRRPPRITDIG